MKLEREKLQRLTKILKADSNVMLGYFFGSVAKGRENAKDVDIAIYLKKEVRGLNKLSYLTDLTAALERPLRRPGDLVILNGANSALCQQVLKYGILIFERKKGVAAKFAFNTMTRYFDYLEILNFFSSYGKKRKAE
ncbi:MAG: nucleotidyltransferase domain-containing protein [Pseudomonadota bacterium]